MIGRPMLYGPNKTVVKILVWLSWPIIILAKRLSAAPILKWIINPFFKRPHNEVTSIPINVDLEPPGSVPLARRLVERLVSEVEDKFILHECICRGHNHCASPPRDIGCIALGPAIGRIHPSNGRIAGTEEAVAHIRRAAEEGLIANVAHVWIDPLAFGTRFRDLMFICFCDDDNCLYRTYMSRRGPNLDGAYEKLPGISIVHDPERCDGCGDCEKRCFVKAIEIQGEQAIDSGSCVGCGRCVEVCKQDARSLVLEDEDVLFTQLADRINHVSELPFSSSRK